MAFCTSCGANVTGPFCAKCGAPSSASAQAAPPPSPSVAPPAAPVTPVQAVPQPSYYSPGAGAVTPVKRGTSPIVWVLVIILGLFVLGGIAVVGGGMFLVHKAKQAGLDPELMQRHPGLAVSKMIAAANPDVEVLNTNDSAGTITVRDKKTGQVTTLNFDDAKKGNFKFTAKSNDGGTATMEFGTTDSKAPAWIPSYPGAKMTGTFAVKGNDGNSNGEGGTFQFTTSDSAATVMSFFKDKLTAQGMKINLTTTTDSGSMIMAADEGEKHVATVTASGKPGEETSVAVTYQMK
ncbi:MAG TPA: hypothetical protein VG675_18370 [Bryobacteraceae bacterium]|nr:hypothetical protein [Bryobacteraceae bacterium]